jgi:hypothetical protein
MNFETKLCRICLKSDLDDDFIDIFDYECDIATEVLLITSVKVGKSIYLKQQTQIIFFKITQQSNRVDLICQNCLEKLNTATEFRSSCLEADKYFQQFEESFINEDVINEQSTINIEIIPKERVKSRRKTSPKKKQLKYECEMCDKLFSCRYYLQKHEYAIHTEINPEEYFECDSCVYKSKTKSLMRSHQINNHSFLK